MKAIDFLQKFLPIFKIVIKSISGLFTFRLIIFGCAIVDVSLEKNERNDIIENETQDDDYDLPEAFRDDVKDVKLLNNW